MAKGLNILTNYANRLQAWADWQRARAEAEAAGFTELAAQLQPPEGATWRKIDKATVKLLRALPANKRSAYWKDWTI